MKKIVILILLALASSKLLFSAPALAQTPIQTTLQIPSGVNDVNEDGSSFQAGSTTVWHGTASSTTNSFAGLRYTNVNIPPNATITSANLQVYSTQNSWIGVSFALSADNVDNSIAFSSSSRPSGRTQTSQKINSTTNSQWLANTWYTVANISPVLQQIINRPNWQQNNSISLLIKGTGTAWGRKYFRSYEGNSSQAAKLVITYVPAPTPVPTYSISGTVFVDTNGDGVQTEPEDGYDNTLVELSGSSTGSTNTTPSGGYAFSSLYAGSYTVAATIPTGYQSTTENPVTESIAANTSINFGVQLIPTPTPTPVPTPDQAQYYVSTSGSDSNNGSLEAPYLTIQKAVNTTKTDSNDGAIIHVLPGTYRANTSINGVNGTELSPVQIQAENGPDTVFVNGSESSKDTRISWVQSTGSAQFVEAAQPYIYYADVAVWNATPEIAVDTTTSTLTRLSIAREPDWTTTTEWKHHENWWKADGAPDPSLNILTDNLDDEPSSYPEAVANAGNLTNINGFTESFLTGARVFLKDTYAGHDSYNALITSHDATGNGSITLDKNLTYYNGSPAIGQYSKYFVENASQLLDQPGEWYYDKTIKRLYIWPPQDVSPAELDLEFATRFTTFYFQNSSYVNIKDMTLQFANYGYGASGGPEGAIRFFGGDNDLTHHITFDKLHIRHSGVGVRLYQPNTFTTSIGNMNNITLKNSTVEYTDAYAMIVWQGPPVLNPNPSIHHLFIDNNEFGHMGFRGSGLGILTQQPEKIVFTNNYLHHSAHNAIEIQQGRGSGNSLILAKNNLLEKNCYNGTDCGAFKFWNTESGSGANNILVSHNIFRGTKGWSYASEAQSGYNSTIGMGYGGFGYYSDVIQSSTLGQGCAITAFRNIIYDNSSAGMQYTRSRDQCAFNNIVAQNDVGIRMNNFGATIDGSFNNKMLKNIFVFSEPTNPTNAKAYGISARINQADEGQLLVDQNIYNIFGLNSYDMYKQDISFTNVGTWETVDEIRTNTPWEDAGMDTTSGSVGITTETQYDISTIEQSFGVNSVPVPAEAQDAINALEAEYGITITNSPIVGRLQ